MKLSEVLDLEVQLAVDEGHDDRALRTRDRSLYLGLAPPPTRPDALLTAWLNALRERFGAPCAGARFDAAQRVLGYLLAALGLGAGWGTAEVLLHFEQGGAPVNVGHFLLVLVFAQLATLVLLTVSVTLRRLFVNLPVVGDVSRLLRALNHKLQALVRTPSHGDAESEAQHAAFRRARSRLGLYAELERYALLGHSQVFALCFNLGALASCARLILLSDLAFAWSTSVASLDPAQVRAITSVLAWPFGWLVPEAVPSAALIEHTQYFRLEGRFSGAAAGTRGDAALAGEWWRFLMACTITYGLLPRVLTLALFRGLLRRAEQRVPLDTPAVQRVLARMTTPELSTRASTLAVQGAEPSHRVAAPPTQATAGPSVLIVYRDIPTAHALLTRALAQHLGVDTTQVLTAGGFDPRGERAVDEALRADGATAAVLVEAWEAPDKGLRSYLAHVRDVLGPRRTLRVILIGEANAEGYDAAAEEQVRVFRDRLTLLEDPYLSVETLPAARAAAPGNEPDGEEARR